MKKIFFTFCLFLICSIQIFAQPKEMTTYLNIEWSPNGKYLSFTKLQGTFLGQGKMPIIKADIYVMKADGSDLRKITGDEKNEFISSWGKNNILYFDANPANNNQEKDIFSMNWDGTHLTQITKNIGRSANPKISPDGKHIIFNLEKGDSKAQIYKMNLDGTSLTALTNDNTLRHYNPIWSPDGKKIVFYTEKGDQKDQIWTMNADGSNPQLLTGGTGHNFYPSWSANGKSIIFSRKPESELNQSQGNSAVFADPSIFIMNADGTNLLDFHNLKGSNPKFSPDGKRIIFTQGGEIPSILVVNADGTNLRKLIGN